MEKFLEIYALNCLYLSTDRAGFRITPGQVISRLFLLPLIFLHETGLKKTVFEYVYSNIAMKMMN